jgi:hypothetical protein
MKGRRLEWLGHLARMDSERTANKLLGGKSGRRRGEKGRPRLSWMDDVELNWRNLRVKGEDEVWDEDNGQPS